MSDPQRPNHGDLPQLDRQQITFTLIGLLVGIFLAALDQTIVSTAAPIIQKDLKISNQLFPWLTTAYLLSSTVFVPIWGKLSDLYGRRRIFMTGLVIFLIGSVLCGISQTGMALVLSRGVQGLGSAALFTTAFATIADIFSPDQRARFGGLFGAMFGISSILGPLLGGWLTDSFSWHWVFFVNLPLGIIALYFILSKMPQLKRHWGNERPKVDWIGGLLLMVGTIPLLLALSLGHNPDTQNQTGYAWTSWQILSMFAVSIAGFLTFYVVEQRTPEPLIHFKMFKDKTFALGNLANFIVGGVFLAAIVFLPLFMVNVVGLSATRAGLTTLPLTFGLLLANIFSGQLASRVGKIRPIILGALAILSIGFLLMGFTLTTTTGQLDVSWKMFIVGMGLGPSIPLFTLAIQSTVQPRYLGIATSTGTFLRQMGSTIGIAILGSVFATNLTTSFGTQLKSIQAELPQAIQAQFGALGSSSEGSNSNFDPKAIKEKVFIQLDEQQRVLELALRDSDPKAIASLLANPNVPENLKGVLRQGGISKSIADQFAAQYAKIQMAIRSGSPKTVAQMLQDPTLPQALRDNLSRIPAQAIQTEQGQDQVLQNIKANLDRAQTAATSMAVSKALSGAQDGLASTKKQISAAIDQAGAAFKQALTESISFLYKVAIFIVLLAFVVTFLMPEAHLRKNQPHAPAAME